MTKQEALKEVAKRVATCKGCQFAPNQKPVPGEGSADAEIFFVGEAPGAKENKTGRPFVGAAGQFLEEMLGSIGLKRADVFIGNIIKYQPPGNRDPLPEEIAYQLPFLKKQLAIIKPKLIVLLGRHALYSLLPHVEQRISQIHGQLLEHDDQQYLPLYHPAAALYTSSMRQTLVDDFAKIPKFMDEIK